MELECECLSETEVWGAAEREIGIDVAPRGDVLAETNGKLYSHCPWVLLVLTSVDNVKKAVFKGLMAVNHFYLDESVRPGAVLVFPNLQSDQHCLTRAN